MELKKIDRKFEHLDKLARLYKNSFPDQERKSFEMILKGIDHCIMDGYVLMDDEELCGLAFVIRGKEGVILDYLAVDPSRQNQHLGSFVLEKIRALYNKPVIVEIESTQASDDPLLHSRKRFYLRNGFLDCHEEIELFGVDMELLSTAADTDFLFYREILRNYFKDDIDRFVWKKPVSTS